MAVRVRRAVEINAGCAFAGLMLFAFWCYLTDFRHPMLSAGLTLANGLTFVIGWAAEGAFRRWRTRRQTRIFDQRAG
jgi:hypothetical protein